MEKALFVLSIALAAADRQHPRFPRAAQDPSPGQYTKVECTNEYEVLRDEMIQKSSCGEPRDMYVHLYPSVTYEQVMPGAVWVKRCAGLCEHGTADSSCVATSKKIQEVAVRIYNVKTDKEYCALYQLEVHESCGCCSPPNKCASRRVFDPRKCTCQCPNLEEKRRCHRKRSQHMKWNRFKCTCEKRRRTSARGTLSRL